MSPSQRHRFFTDPADANPHLLGALQELLAAVTCENVDPQARQRAIADAEAVVMMCTDGAQAEAVVVPDKEHTHRVTLVQVQGGGADVVAYLDGRLVVGGDPTVGYASELVQQAAEHLADILGAGLDRCVWQAPGDAPWAYTDIADTLFGELD